MNNANKALSRVAVPTVSIAMCNVHRVNRRWNRPRYRPRTRRRPQYRSLQIVAICEWPAWNSLFNVLASVCQTRYPLRSETNLESKIAISNVFVDRRYAPNYLVDTRR